MRWTALAFLFAFGVMEVGALMPVAHVASVDVDPRIAGRVNEAAIDWALVTRDPYVERETVRAFRTDVLGDRGPDVAVLERLIRQRMTVERAGDALRLSIRAPDRSLSESAARYFGERLRYYVKSPLRDIILARREKLGMESYRLRRRLALPAVADTFLPAAPLSEAELAAAAQRVNDPGLVQRLRDVEAELASLQRGPYATSATIAAPRVTTIRRISKPAAHVMALAIGIGVAALALLASRIARLGVQRGSLRVSVAIALGAFALPGIAGALSAALQFEARAVVRLSREGAPASDLAERFGRAPQTFLDRKEFPELWDEVRSTRPPMAIDYDFVLPDVLHFDVNAGEATVGVLFRSPDSLDAETAARTFARRLAPRLAGGGALARYREHAKLPQKIRDAETRLRWHDAELLKNLPDALRKTHEAARLEDLATVKAARDAIATPPDALLAAEQAIVDDAVRARPSFGGLRSFIRGPGRTIAGIIMLALLVWLVAAVAIGALSGDEPSARTKKA
jgi:hypothetical protein